MVESSEIAQGLMAGFAGLGGVFFLLHKLNLLRILDKPPAAAADVMAKQFEIIKTSMTDMEARQKTLETMLSKMDRQIHEQQRTITRMEMLLRQFSGLVQEHGVTVPSYMQEELRDLIDNSDTASFSRKDSGGK